MNLILKIFLFCLLLSSCSSQQALVQNPINDSIQIQGNVKDIAMDELGYIYLLTKDNLVHRCNSEFTILFTFSNKRQGNIHSLDVSNPLKLIAFYNQYGIVTALDNTLTESFVLDLQEFGYEDVQAIGLSSDNQLWLYDPLDFKLKKIDNRGELLFESNSMVHEGLEMIKPLHLHEAINKVYLFEQEALFLFDDYGKFLKRIDLQQMRDYQVNKNGDVVWSDGAALHVLSMSGLDGSQQFDSNLQLENIEKFILLPSKVITLDNKGYYTVQELN